jgi:hypothetical protein
MRGMSKTNSKRSSPKARFTLGRQGFAKISAVEGVRLSPAMEERFREFDRKKLPAAARREAIARAFGKPR